MFDHNRDYPRAFAAPDLSPDEAERWAVEWAARQAEALGQPLSIYVPQKGDVEGASVHIADLIDQGVAVTAWRGGSTGRGVVIALWPDEQHLLAADESRGTAALVAVPGDPGQILGWAQAKGAECLGGEAPEPLVMDPVVAVAVERLGLLVGQHKPIDSRYRALLAAGIDTLRRAGYTLDPAVMHTRALRVGWTADNADTLRVVVRRLNGGKVIQGMRDARLADGVLEHWRSLARGEEKVE